MSRSRKLHTLSLFPDDREIPKSAVGSLQVKLSGLELSGCAFGDCWLACELWRRLGLEDFWQARLPAGREEVPWEKVLRLLVVNRWIAPGSEFRVHRQWFVDSAMDELLETESRGDLRYRRYRAARWRFASHPNEAGGSVGRAAPGRIARELGTSAVGEATVQGCAAPVTGAKMMTHPVYKVVAFEIVGRHSLRVEFDDGTAQVIDFGPILRGELYGPLEDERLFRQVEIDPEVHTLVWPTGADFDPAVLYDWPQHASGMRQLAERWPAVESKTS